ncbi:MAG TPA: mechanosensitive ion channel domain-containing protein [Luteibaculaceae bacterium]|nr:mechanosensitive ion channel domain-containing protein [Luteibaculaceae bacterium]
MSILHYNFIDFNGFKLSLIAIIWLILLYLGVNLMLRIFRVMLHRSFVKRNIADKGREYTIYSLVRYFVFTLGLFITLATLGVEIGWLFSAGIPLLVGIGLGLQSIFRDFVSGIVIIFEGSVKVGDAVEIDGIVAMVRKIELRTSKVETRDGISIIVPNSKMIDDKIINWSHNKKETRTSIRLTLPYSVDTASSRHLLYQVIIANPAVSKIRKPTVLLDDFGDHGLQFRLSFWCHEPWELEVVKSDIRYALDKALREKGIEIPYHQLEMKIIK